SGFAACALATCAGATPDSVELQVKRHDTSWHEQARLWVAMVGPPSVRKSPILGASTKPLRKLNDEMARNYHRAMDAYLKLDKKERETADKPKREALILNDTTMEAAQEVMKDSPNGVLCVHDELSGWFSSMDRYS